MGECTKGCGDCCERFYIGGNRTQGIAAFRARMTAYLANVRTVGKSRKDIQFMHDNFVSGEQGGFTCLKFDRQTRSCTAHNDRPSVCSGFPWYGKEPDKMVLGYGRCTYITDTGVKLLPIVAVT
jgi:Fe-S-cluster containining protein